MTEQQAQQPQQPQPPQPQPQQPTAPLQPIQQPQQQPQQPQQIGGFNVGNMSVQDANDSIIAQLQAQNAALIEQNNNLNAQVVRMVQNGAQFAQQPQQPQQVQPQQVPYPFDAQNPPQFQYAPVYSPEAYMPTSLTQDVDVSLESLASEIGKKPQ